MRCFLISGPWHTRIDSHIPVSPDEEGGRYVCFSQRVVVDHLHVEVVVLDIVVGDDDGQGSDLLGSDSLAQERTLTATHSLCQRGNNDVHMYEAKRNTSGLIF